MNRLATRLPAVLSCAVLLAACGQPGEPAADSQAPSPATTSTVATEVISRVAPVTDIDLNVCLARARGEATSTGVACPTFITKGLGESIAGCKEAGGIVVAATTPSLYSLDVNLDGRRELLYDMSANFSCEGALLYFSCGSQGCPVGIFEQRPDEWTAIGDVRDGEGVEVVPGAAGSAYGTIREGCRGVRPCDEVRYSTWDGSAYQLTAIEARGHWVDFDNDGLWRLTKDSAVLATPMPGAATLDSYVQGTEMIVLGTARGSQFKYVSPCNACASGFIDPAVLRKD